MWVRAGRRSGGRRRRPAALTVALLGAAALAAGVLVPATARADPPAVGGAALATTGTAVAPDAPPLPAVVDAGSWLVADLDTGDVLAAHDAHGRFAPASTLKILTALTVIPRLDPDQSVLVTPADTAVDGTRVGIVPGHTYTVATLLQGLLMVSGNDAALALASQTGGTDATVAAMNAKAASLQADDTTARTVDGLDAPGQASSAYDLALLARAALALPSFRTDVGTERVPFAGDGVAPFQISNHDPLLGAVPGVYGVKNGYTDAARASYVGAARRGGHDVVVVVMRTVPDFVPESKALFDWGFAADGAVTPVGSLDPATATLAASAVAHPAASTLRAAVARRSGISDGTWLTVGVAAGTALLLLQGRRVQVRRRRTRSRRVSSPGRPGTW